MEAGLGRILAGERGAYEKETSVGSAGFGLHVVDNICGN